LIGIWDAEFGGGDGGSDDGSPAGFVYFIRHPSGHIKIGYSKDVASRLRGLQTANPINLSLIGFVPGTRQDERALHRKLGEWRSGGEWFMPSREVVEEVSRILSVGFIGGDGTSNERVDE